MKSKSGVGWTGSAGERASGGCLAGGLGCKILSNTVVTAVVLAAHLTVPLCGWTQNIPLAPGGQVRNAKLRIYTLHDTNATAVLQADRIGVGFERRGFFRIGALPLVLIEGLQIQVQDREQFPSAIEQSRVQLPLMNSGRTALEAQGFSLTMAWVPEMHLSARKVTAGDGPWRLEAVVLQSPTYGTNRFVRAVLEVSGPGAGKLRVKLATGKYAVFDLLAETEASANTTRHHDEIHDQP